MSIIIRSYEDLKKHTVLLEPSKFDFVAFWNEDLEEWDMRAKVVRECTGDEGNLEFFDVVKDKRYKPPKIDDPGWEEYNILSYIQTPGGGGECYEWRIFKGDLNLLKIIAMGDLMDLSDVLYGLGDGANYIPVKVHGGIKSMVSKDTLGTFGDFMDQL